MMVEKNGKIRLLDFGIARNAGAGQEMTLPGSVLGTAAYMSPEQISAQPVTPLSDLFSLGIIASEMLLGKNPFRGETIEQTSQFILNVKLSPKHFPADVPKPLRHFVCKILEKKPQNRFKDAQAAADALANLMVDFPRQLDLPLAQWLRATCAQVPYTDVIQQNYSRKKWIIFGLGALAPTLLFVLIFVIKGLFS
jgi:serine/threonine-protein kinase